MKDKEKKLGDYIDIITGFAFKTKDFVEDGVPIIKIKNIKPPSVTLDDLTYVNYEIAEKQKKFILEYNDVLIAMTGSHINQWESVVGRVARVKYNAKTLLNQRVGKIIPKREAKVNIDFIYYYLSQDTVKIELAAKAGGAANQANISPDQIKCLKFPCPPIGKQIRIASFLKKFDDLIENNQKQIKLLEEAAQRLYKEWFVDLRFPGYEQTKIVDGVPEGWEKGSLEQIGFFKRGKTITSADLKDGVVPVIAGGIEPAYYHNKANTVAPVVTVSGSGANAGYTSLHHVDVFASDCSYADNLATPYVYFIYCFLKANKACLNNLQKGAAQPHVYAKDINIMNIIVPTNIVLDSFTEAASLYFIKIKNIKQQITLLAEARDRLLPKLMNGEIEV